MALKRIRVDVERLAATYGLDPETAVAHLESKDDYGAQTLILEAQEVDRR